MSRQIDNSLVHETCPACAGHQLAHVGVLKYALPTEYSSHQILLSRPPELWRCLSCGTRFTQNAIPEAAAMELYRSGQSGERWSRASFADVKPPEVTRALGRLLQPKARVLDIGCNTGQLLDFAKAQGCITEGIEPSESSRSVAAANGHVMHSSLADVTSCFDVITGFDLVEHLYDIPAFFSAVRARLVSEGALVLLTGDVGSLSARLAGSQWWYARYPEHVVFPSRRYLATKSGFRRVKFLGTYAASGYRTPLKSRFKRAAYSLYKGHYNGLPAVGPDHMLAIMKP